MLVSLVALLAVVDARKLAHVVQTAGAFSSDSASVHFPSPRARTGVRAFSILARETHGLCDSYTYSLWDGCTLLATSASQEHIVEALTARL